MKQRYTTRDLKKLGDRTIFFDTNILIYLFGFVEKRKWIKEYSKIFRILLEQNNRLVVDITVISELINRMIRLEYEKYLLKKQLIRNQFKFKNYRKSNEGKNTIKEIYQIINQDILKYFELIEETLTINDIKEFLKISSMDFSDHIIEKICKKNNFILLTNDSDFKNSEIEIISVNNKILER